MTPGPVLRRRGWPGRRRALAESTGRAELSLYLGCQHLFADSALPTYEPAAAALLTQRFLDFLRLLEPPELTAGPQAYADHGRSGARAIP